MSRKKKPTQKDRVLQYIKDYGSITRFEAFTELGITELPKRICELQDLGFKFNKEWLTRKNRYGDPVSFIQYSLSK